jgi:hypothetical protein
MSVSVPRALSSSQMPLERRHCQTIALYTGFPVARSHTTVVSRWFVMPIAAICVGFDLGGFDDAARRIELGLPDLLGIVLDPARLGKICRNGICLRR